MNKTTIAFASAGVGAAAMYLLDPSRGRRRRARLAEAASHVSHRAQAVAGMTARDVRHRVSGLAARTLDQLVEEGTPSNEVLAERVRARLGRLVSHPGAIDVVASGGTVTLKGPVFEAEVDQLMQGVAAVAGVTTVENSLEPHRDAAHVSALQGPGPRTVPSPLAAWLRWTPTTRLIAGVAGLALLALSSPRRVIRGAATGITGIELAQVLHPHSSARRKLPYPLWGWLPPSRGVLPAGAADVLSLTDALPRELPRMLEEHKRIHAAVEQLRKAARDEHATRCERLAEQLAQHAQTEEEVLYPARYSWARLCAHD